jgi:hypothetical protein
MPTRIRRLAAVLTACPLGLLGLLTVPHALLAHWVVIASVTGLFVAFCVRSSFPDKAVAVRCGTAAGGGLLAAGLITAGLVVLLGAGAVLVVAALAAATVWAWRRRRVRAEKGATRSGAPPSPGRPFPAFPPRRHLLITDASTTHLCVTWERSCRLLRDLGPGTRRDDVIALRGRLLDELERRDPQGFDRWVHADPRTGTDPGRHLTAER